VGELEPLTAAELITVCLASGRAVQSSAFHLNLSWFVSGTSPGISPGTTQRCCS
jgi:hypothetical protein